MGRYSGKTCRLLSMLALTGSFFVVEITVGYISNSIALVADSFHMLSDVVALIVGFASVRVSKWKTKKNTFGWQRAEVLGALVNTVFLIALCFTIVVESLQRFIEIEPIEQPVLLLIVGVVGLLINLVGLALFHQHGHGHSHGGHAHGSGEEDTIDFDENQEEVLLQGTNSVNIDTEKGAAISRNGEATAIAIDSSGDKNSNGHGHGHSHDKPKKTKSSAHLNMKGVFLHVLGDALGSVVVIISAVVIWQVNGDWKFYVDPALSMLMVIIMLGSAIPLLKETSLILLQTVPTHIQVKSLQDKLITKVDGVLAIHEFHIWRLTGDRIIASAHIKCRNLHEYVRIAEEVKEFFHDEGIHSTTIQPEFEDLDDKDGRACVLECGPDKTCHPNTCCGEKRVIARIRDKERSPSHLNTIENRHSAVSGQSNTGTSPEQRISVISNPGAEAAVRDDRETCV
ncbi:proton-coupled zinc antiporter SLC30A1-like [Lineus longissimus]|uniref:proton-coupled zinc antiporter SLC30A1-like n=1 Tax=Lineus longissimus TaxID=88925 RepID=UPI002B4F7CE9